LGSSTGGKGQVFTAAQKPVLPEQVLLVREMEMPSATELDTLFGEEGADAVTVVPTAPGRPQEVWVRWHETVDFYASGPCDRHYVVNRLTGEVRFGDGQNGLIPPLGAANVKLALYRTGGGGAGNRAAGTVVQLKSTIPYVDAVTNTEPATGGADAEDLESVIARVPRSLRHRGRAVTREDYEDLARLASPDVARARCVPLADLAGDPRGRRSSQRGRVSLIVVPRTADPRPQPGSVLLARVWDFVSRASAPTVDLSVVGPTYVPVNVTAVLGVTTLDDAAGAVQGAAVDALRRFLHPLLGGPDGSGWDFGRKPQLSDLYRLLATVPGVDYVRQVSVTPDENDAVWTRLTLVHAGALKV
jgi:predicted phage baseplate assembly protein